MTKIYAHRGFSSIYPENSMDSIKEAIKYDYIDGIEIDVRMTKDKKFVLIHNRDISDISKDIGNVNDYTLEELKKIDFHYNKTDYKISLLKSFINKDGVLQRKRLKKIRKYTYKVVTLEEVLDIIKDKILLIEIKYNTFDKFDLKEFYNIISKYKNKNIEIQCFSKKIIKDLKKIDNKLKLGILIWDTNIEEKIKIKTNFISIKDNVINSNILDNELYKKKIINIWTVDYYKQFRNLVKNVDGKINELNIITNYPDLIYKYLNNFNKK